MRGKSPLPSPKIFRATSRSNKEDAVARKAAVVEARLIHHVQKRAEKNVKKR
jgi:hypothetical protein